MEKHEIHLDPQVTVTLLRRQQKQSRAEETIGKEVVIVQIVWPWPCLAGGTLLISVRNAIF